MMNKSAYFGQTMNITLIGMPGSGKSHVGALLAERCGLVFVDTDKVLEGQFAMPLQHVVDLLGHENFLDAGAAAVTEAFLEVDGVVLSPGGSVVLRERGIGAAAQ